MESAVGEAFNVANNLEPAVGEAFFVANNLEPIFAVAGSPAHHTDNEQQQQPHHQYQAPAAHTQSIIQKGFYGAVLRNGFGF